MSLSNQTSSILYQHHQKGILMICIMILVFMIGIGFFLFFVPIAGWICLGSGLTVGSLFYKLTTRVTAESIYIAYGMGLIHRSIPLHSIQAVKAVQNPWWYGFGIRYTPHGWLWNIQGLEAVEITYSNGKQFRIGTDDVDGLVSALTSCLQL